MRESFMLPTGKTTTSSKKYIDAWHKLAGPFCGILNAQLCAYDPGISLVTNGGKVVDFDLWVTLRLYKAIVGEDFTE